MSPVTTGDFAWQTREPFGGRAVQTDGGAEVYYFGQRAAGAAVGGALTGSTHQRRHIDLIIVAAIHIMWILGIIALVIGAVFAIAGLLGHEIGGRKHIYVREPRYAAPPRPDQIRSGSASRFADHAH